MPKLIVYRVNRGDDRMLPVFAEFDELADRIRDRAYELFSRRGFGHGRALEDWLIAEQELCGSAAELAENETGYVLTLELPGFEAGDIAVTSTPNELMVKATHGSEDASGDPRGASRVHWSEYHSESVFRRIELPRPVDVDKVSARLKEGVLTVDAPKTGALGQEAEERRQETKATRKGKKTGKKAQKKRSRKKTSKKKTSRKKASQKKASNKKGARKKGSRAKAPG